MVRIVFVNLHANAFLVKTLSKYIWKQPCSFKHRYFLHYLINRPDVEVCNYVNEAGFTLVNSLPKPIMWILRKLCFAENRFVMRINGIPRDSVKVIKKEEIRKDDIVIGYRNFPPTLAEMESIDAFKVVSMIHFHGSQADSAAIERVNPNILINECDLSKYSDIFKRYYSWYKGRILVHPFVAAARFQAIKPFSERESRCFSTGTITYKRHPEFLEVYGDPCDQPSRKQIVVNQSELTQLVACYNSDYLEDTEMKEYLPEDSKLTHYRKVWYNMKHTGKQKKYNSFNMVEKFNDFKMCLVGEEILGIPGIGFVEGMACGCAYIGQRLGYYEDYGMEEGVHYIGYDGTLDDLKTKIAYYQLPEHEEELQHLATAGRLFAEEHFREEPVARFLLDHLIEEQRKSASN